MMSRTVTKLWRALLGCAMLALILAACTPEDARKAAQEKDLVADPVFSAALFTNPTQIDNPHYTLTPGTTRVFQAFLSDSVETSLVQVTNQTRVVAGVTCVVVRDSEYEDDLLVEDTWEWFAQDDAGNVWYMGEDTEAYEYDDNEVLIATTTEGSWEAGLDVVGVGSIAQAGILIKAVHTIGDTYPQEFYPGEAEDMARCVGLNIPVTLRDGRSFGCVQIREWNPLEGDSKEYKYYAPGVGLVSEGTGSRAKELKAEFVNNPSSVPNFAAAVFTAPQTITHNLLNWDVGNVFSYQANTDEGLETITIEVLATTQVVNGVTCRVIRDRVYLDGLIIEDTYDWVAQDDAGNVWNMGEDVLNYEYDAQGTLIGTNTNGSWEAGVNGALPGFWMPATPVADTSFYQEYQAGVAEDMAYVLSTSASVSVGTTQYSNCLLTVDWNPLEPEVLEYKYYAPGVGRVVEVKTSGEERVELVSVTP